MAEIIGLGERQTRKPHQCFDCYRTIPAGERCYFFTGKTDYVYTIYSHLDCNEMSNTHLREVEGNDWDEYDGIQPLWDRLTEDGELEHNCNWYRGRFPHVVTRMEHNQQEHDARWEERMRNDGD